MIRKSIGLIETVGLAAGIEAADAAVKSANVKLIGYELSKGNGMTVIKVEGDVGAVKAAISAAEVAARRVTSVFSSKVIPRPANDLDKMIFTKETVMNTKAYPEEVEVIEEVVENETITEEITESVVETETVDEPAVEELEPSLEVINDKDEKIEEVAKEDIVNVQRSIIATETKEKAKGNKINENTAKQATCNICNDPACSRKKGEPKKHCIHYKGKGDK